MEEIFTSHYTLQVLYSPVNMFVYVIYILCCNVQHNKWVCSAAERRASDIPPQSIVAAPQGEVAECLSSTACVLRRPVPRERPDTNRTGKRHTQPSSSIALQQLTL